MDNEIFASLNDRLQELNELLASQRGKVSDFTKSTSSAKTAIDSATTAANQGNTSFNLSSQRILQRVNEINALTKAQLEAERLELEKTNNMKSALYSSKNALGQFKDALLSGEQGFGKYGGSLNSLGSAASSLGKNFGILGTVIGKLLQVEFMVAAHMAKQADAVAKATDSVAKLGAINQFSMADINDMGYKAGLSSFELDKMIKPMQSVQGGFIGLGKTQGEGIQKFGELLDVGEKFRKQTRRLGMDDEARNQAIADWLTTMNMAGESFRGELSTKEGQRKAAAAYIVNLYELQQLSGKSLDQLKTERQDLMSSRAAILETTKLDEADRKAAEILKTGTPEQRLRAQKERERIANERKGFDTLIDSLISRGVDRETAIDTIASYATRVANKSDAQAILQGYNQQDTFTKLGKGQLTRGQVNKQATDALGNTIEAMGTTLLTSSSQAAEATGTAEKNNAAIAQFSKQVGTDRVAADTEAKRTVDAQMNSQDPAQLARDKEVETTRKARLAASQLEYSMNPFVGSKGGLVSFSALIIGAGLALFAIPAALGVKNILSSGGKGAVGKLALAGGVAAGVFGLGSLAGALFKGEGSTETDENDNDQDLDIGSDISEIPEENQINPEDQANTKLQAINKQIVTQSKHLNDITKQLSDKSTKLMQEQKAQELILISKYKLDPKVVESNSQAVQAYAGTLGDASNLAVNINELTDVMEGYARISTTIYNEILNFSKITFDENKTNTNVIAFLNFSKAIGILSGGKETGLLQKAASFAGSMLGAMFGGPKTTATPPPPATSAHASGKDVIIGNQRRSGGTISWRTNNPGNNVYGALSKKYGAIGSITAADGEPVAIFPSLDQGLNMQIAQWRRDKYNNFTIGEGVRTWTGGNQPVDSPYARDLAKAAGATIDTVVGKLSDGQLKALVQKQAHWEGFKPGTVTQAKLGGLFSGPSAGYIMELHGTEMIIPMEENSILAKMANETASTAKDIQSSNAVNVTKNSGKNVALSHDMVDKLARKFDNAINVLKESDYVHDKILRHSSM